VRQTKPAPTLRLRRRTRARRSICSAAASALPPLADGSSAIPPSKRELAEAVSVSIDTVKTHLPALFEAFRLDGIPQHHKRAKPTRLAIQAASCRPGNCADPRRDA
jgi:hypothetical protein